ncbi:MAG: choice-of-anchor J domain-containing protein [Saprospiraceae bacterium]|nr:choice-of-anchor J domain-containing protein [Saprospiraceae bacterium]
MMIFNQPQLAFGLAIPTISLRKVTINSVFFLAIFALVSISAKAQVLFYEDFDGIPGPTAGGAGTYTFAPGFLLRNVDNRTPNVSVSYVNDAWERREDFANNVADSCAFSTSWYTPEGAANDFMWTPVIGPLPANCMLSWNALVYDPAFPDGYEVRIMTDVPTGGTGVIGNQISNSTVLYSTTSETPSWTTRFVNLNAYTGQSVYIGFRNNSDNQFLLLIDDIKVEVSYLHDVVMQSFKTTSEYTRLPLALSPSLPFSGVIKNEGLNAITNVVLTAKAYDSTNALVFTGTSPALASLASGSSSNFNVSTSFSPVAAGDYIIKYIASMAESGGNVTNDTLTETITITPTTHARDNGTPTGSLGIGTGVEGYLGNAYGITNTAEVKSVSIFFTGQEAGEKYGVAIFRIQNKVPTTKIYQTPMLVLPAAVNGAWVDVDLFPAVPLLFLPGDTLLAVAVEYDSTLTIGNTAAKFTPEAMWTFFNGSGGWQTLENFGPSFAKPLMIRVNYGNVTPYLTSTTPTNQTICSGSIAVINSTSNLPTTDITWTRDQTVNVTGLPANGSGSVNGPLINNTAADITVMFIFTPSIGGMSGIPDTAFVIVKPLPSFSGVTVTQPVLPMVKGTITVNATGSSALSYQLNGGTSQASNVFSNLMAGDYNVSVSYVGNPSCPVSYASNPVTINSLPARVSKILAGASPFQDSMWVINLENYTIINRLGPSLTGFTITGLNGLATHPVTGQNYAILKLSGVSGRVLAKIDILTGVCTSVGNLGDNFSSITFRSDGQMFGVTGDGATVPETLYLIDHTNASKTLARALGNGADGEVILYVPESDAFYHWSGGTVIFEKIDAQPPYTITNIPISGNPVGETFGSFYLGSGEIIVSNISSQLKLWDTTGVVNPGILMNCPDDLRGLVGKCCLSSIEVVGANIICGNDGVNLQTNGGIGNYQWFLNGTDIGGATSSSFIAFTPGNYNAVFTDSCGIRDSVALGILVTQLPGATANAGSDTLVCASTEMIPIHGAYGGTATSATWSTSGTGTFSPNAATSNARYIRSLADTTAGSVTLFLTTNDPPGDCGPAVDTVVITFDPASIINAGPDQTICATDTIFLHATLSGLATSMVWQKNVAFGTFVGPDTSPNAKFLLNANGMTQTSISFGAMSNDPGGNVCQGGLDTVVYFINPKATVNAGADVTICASQTTLQLNGNFGGAASTAAWSTSGTGTFTPNASTLNAQYVFSAADTTANAVNLILTTDDPTGLCGPAKDTLAVRIDPESIINAGPDQTVCATDTIFLHATLSGVATSMVWQKNAAFGNFVGSDTSPDAKFVLNATGMALPSISFGAMSNDPGANVCQGGVDTVVIFIDHAPTVNAGADVTICSSTPSVTLNGSIGGTASSATWSGGTGGFVPSPNTLSATYQLSPTDITNGQAKLYLTTNNPAGQCGPAVDSMVITIQRAATVNAGPDQMICSNSPVITLAGSIGGSASSANWGVNPPNGVYSPSNTNLNATYTPTPAEVTSGLIAFTLTTNDPAGVCPAVNDQIVVRINPVPNAVAAPSSQVSCSGSPITTIAFSGNVTGTVYSWTRNNPGVTGIASSGTGNISGTLVSTSLVPEVVTFTITPSYTNAGFTCTGTAITATVTVNPKPTLNAVGNQLVCANTSTQAVSFTGAPPAAFFTWTNNNTSIGLGASGTGNIPAFTAINNTGVNQIATITVTPNFTSGNITCQGDVRAFTITVFPGLVITPFNDVEVCEDAAVILGVNLVQMGVPPYTYVWTGPNGFMSSAASPVISPSIWNVHTGAYNVRVTDSNGCSGTATMDVIVNPTPAFTLQPVDLYVCDGASGTVTSAATVANGSPISYTLQLQAGQNWQNIATNAIGLFTLNNLDISMNGNVYRVVALADHNPMPDCERSSELFSLFVHVDQGLACNDMINYSMDYSCSGLITADMIMEGDFINEFYVVTLVDEYGVPVPNPVPHEFIGRILTATVLDICDGNSCSGRIRVEDKLPPVIECQAPLCDLLGLNGEWSTADANFSPGQCWAFDVFAPNQAYCMT